MHKVPREKLEMAEEMPGVIRGRCLLFLIQRTGSHPSLSCGKSDSCLLGTRGDGDTGCHWCLTWSMLLKAPVLLRLNGRNLRVC